MNKKNFLLKCISILLLFAITLNILPNTLYASHQRLSIDGYKVDVLENSTEKIQVQLQDKNDIYIATHEMFSNKFTMDKIEKKTDIVGRSIESKKSKEQYNILIKSYDGNELNAVVKSLKSGTSFEINESVEPISAQATLVIGGGAAALALIKAILAVGAVVVIGGATWYTANKVIDKLRRNQPKIRYYTARLFKGKIVIQKPLKSKSAAAARLRSMGSVFALSSGEAYGACKSASPIGKAEYHNRHQCSRYYYRHYHPLIKLKKPSKAHCWY